MPKFGDVLFHILTEEPCFVIWPTKYFTLVHRPVMGTDGIFYRFKIFPSAELETLQEQTARTISNIQVRNNIAGAEFGPEAMPALQFKKPTTN